MVAEETVLSDEALAELVQKGDKERFGVLMERYESKLLRYGRKFLSNREDIEDVVQEVFIKTYESINNFDLSLKFSSWIYRIAHNTFVNALRKNLRNPLLHLFDFDTLVAHPVYEDPVHFEKEQLHMKKMLDTGLDKLQPSYKEILILYYLEELSYKEISDVLQIPMGTVGIRIKRAKSALKKIYDTLGLHYGEQ